MPVSHVCESVGNVCVCLNIYVVSFCIDINAACVIEFDSIRLDVSVYIRSHILDK